MLFRFMAIFMLILVSSCTTLTKGVYMGKYFKTHQLEVYDDTVNDIIHPMINLSKEDILIVEFNNTKKELYIAWHKTDNTLVVSVFDSINLNHLRIQEYTVLSNSNILDIHDDILYYADPEYYFNDANKTLIRKTSPKTSGQSSDEIIYIAEDIIKKFYVLNNFVLYSTIEDHRSNLGESFIYNIQEDRRIKISDSFITYSEKYNKAIVLDYLELKIIDFSNEPFQIKSIDIPENIYAASIIEAYILDENNIIIYCKTDGITEDGYFENTTHFTPLYSVYNYNTSTKGLTSIRVDEDFIIKDVYNNE